MSQKNYWSNIILDWETASFGDNKSKKHLSILEKIANLFRYPIRNRRKLSVSFIEKKSPTYLMELGCGSGEMSLDLVSRKIVNKVSAFDIASPAIEIAKKNSKDLNVQDQVTFTSASIQDINFNEFEKVDTVVALGLTPYLNEVEFENLIRFCSKRSFFIDFHLEGINFINVLHTIYRNIKKTPFPFYARYNRKKLLLLLKKFGVVNPILEHSEGVYFVKQESK